MKSMTGFGTTRAQTSDVSIEVSVRAVNGRFLEPRFHLPREFMSFESDLRKILTERLKRGTVDLFVIRRQRQSGSTATVHVNKALAKKYQQAYQSLAKDLKLKGDIHLESIARLPDVIKIEDQSEVDPKEKGVLLKAFKTAVEGCVKERLREGKALKAELQQLLVSLEKCVTEISGMREEVNQQLQQRFESRLAGRMKGAEIDAQRINQEIVLQLDKADINEELQRLTEHIKNYRQLLQSPDPEGKKLDFYTQELLREVNTIGSKSQVAVITQTVVDAKTFIERLREQVQNVE